MPRVPSPATIPKTGKDTHSEPFPVTADSEDSLSQLPETFDDNSQ